ncbi:MFS transporter [Nocardia huaxiensis]|uniref:MFS transporter n=1 Tax=Nocardia huaxiensis TaxID=2755382 RepID=UPI001E3B063F|nr:MFS transporter [Nocardia huaxiensis]UFS98477.1 MFS transporter [Nocardia huaxiensis]
MSTIDTQRSAESPTAPSRWLLPIILGGTMLNILDTFVVNVALPTLSSTLHAGTAALELVIAGYIVAFACLLVIGGRLGDIFGRRRVFIIGMAGFVVASTVCGVATSVEVLIAARVAQGAAGALMVPQTLSMIQVLYHGESRQKVLGLFGMANGISAAVGQILGGLLISADIFGLSWRFAFLINIPFGIAGVLAARKVLPETRAPQATTIDGAGAALLGGAMVLLLIPLTVGREQDWPAWCWVLLAASVAVIGLFIVVERRIEGRGDMPLLPMSLMRVKGVNRGLLVCFAIFAASGALLLTLTVALQYGLHYSPVKAGLTLGPYTVALLVGALVSRHLVAKFGRTALFAGGALVTAACLVMAVQMNTGFESLTPLSIAPVQAVIGFGQALLMIPLLGIVLAEVPVAATGAASGAWSTTKEVAVAFGVAGVGALFFTVAADHGFGPATAVAAIAEAVLAAIAAVAVLTLPMPAAAA